MKTIYRLLVLAFLLIIGIEAFCKDPLQPGTISYSGGAIDPGTSAGIIQSSAEATGGDGSPYQYQWQQSFNGTDFGDIAGANDINYNPGTLNQTTWFRRNVSCGNEFQSSNSYVITVNPLLAPGGIDYPHTTPIIFNSDPGLLVQTPVSGGNGIYSYQWQSSPDMITWTDIIGATSADLDPGRLTQRTYFKRLVNSGSQHAETGPAMVSVYPKMDPGTLYAIAGTFYIGQNPGWIQNHAPVAFGCASPNIQWQLSFDNGVTWKDIVGATDPNYDPVDLSKTVSFRRKVECSGQLDFTNLITIQVYPPLTSGSFNYPYNSVAYNTDPGILQETAATGGDGNYHYQWQFSTDAISWGNISGATSETYDPGIMTQTTSFRRIVYDGHNEQTSNYITIKVGSVMESLNPGSIDQGDVSLGDGKSTISLLETAASGGDGIITYQWQFSTDGKIYQDINGAINESYNAQSIGNLSSFYLRRIAWSANVNAPTNSIHVGFKGVVDLPAVYDANSPVNYVRTWDVVAPITDINLLNTVTPVTTAHMSTQYIDGLGRPIQTVLKQGSLITDPSNPSSAANAVDMVSPVYYDPFGREQYKYLPFAANTTGSNTSVNDGAFKLNPFQQQQSFMQNEFAKQGENFFYGQIQYETSPLNRVEESFAPGNSWVGHARSTKANYWINTDQDKVRVWNVQDGVNPGDFGTYSTSNTYPAGDLYKYVSVDEHGSQVIEFKDKEERVILKKVQLTALNDDGSGMNHDEWLCTYYIYDDFNELRCVIQPKGVELLSQKNWELNSFNGKILDEQCFRYEYDEKRRLIVKKVPGAAPIQIVYDLRDRLVMTQDGNTLAQHRWIYTQYDDLNRPFATGAIDDPINYNNPNYHRTQAANQNWPDLGSYNYELYTQTLYDNYEWITDLNAPFSANRSTTYDASFSTAFSSYPYPQPLNQSNATTGLVTGMRVTVPGTGKTLYTINYYDDKGRLIQTQSTNYSEGKDISTTQYSFSGQVLQTVEKQEKPGFNALVTQLYSRYNYDELGRLISTEKKINNSSWKTISSLQYNALGQLKAKTLAPTYNNNQGLETLNYDYNIRGWLLGTNRDYATSSGNTTNFFGFDLGYDNSSINDGFGSSIGSYANTQYNGNITGTVWKTKGDNEIRKYDFSYDQVNRLTAADFTQFTSGNFNKTAGIDFSTSNLSYDANGNILTMNQKGWKGAGSTLIDQLTYTYLKQSNKLLNVVDAVNDENTKLGDFRSSNSYLSKLGWYKTDAAKDYSYDDNGNLIQDNNKDIQYISYNFLNLPELITTEKGTIKYTYDASGNKLQKQVVENLEGGQTLTTTTKYIGGFVYESREHSTPAAGDYVDQLQFFSHEEGRIRLNLSSGKFAYDYFLKDHLGNVRMMLTEEEQLDPYESLTFEDQHIDKQNAKWEDRNGNSINVNEARGANQVDFGGSLQWAMGLQKSIGATKLLKVMAGDRIHTSVDYYYHSANTDNSSNNPLNSFLSGFGSIFLNSPALSSSLHSEEGAIASQLSTNSDLQSFLNPAPSRNPQDLTQVAPQAYLCVAFFDERFQFDKVHSIAIPVNYLDANSGYQTIDRRFADAINVAKSGYAYIYFTNESNERVYFRNFTLTHERGPILEENHYYPFGLTMGGLSSKSMVFGGAENKHKYNGIEFDTSLGIDEYEAHFRDLDPQIGRWWQIDPKMETFENYSPYTSTLNDPILHADPNGDIAESCCKTANDILQATDILTQQIIEAGGGAEDVITDGAATLVSIGGSLAAGFTALWELATEKKELPAQKTTNAKLPESHVNLAKGAQNQKVKEAIDKGNKAHKDFSEKAKNKGWVVTPSLIDPKTGKVVKPDAVTKDGKPVELKPKTKTGKLKGAKQLPKYERATGKKGRVITYDPSQIK